MSGKLPSRGPRVMHGMGKLLAQARSLLPSAGSAQHPNGPMLEQNSLSEHSARMADLAALLQRCINAERRVARAQQVTAALRGQAEQLATDHPARQLAEQIFVAYEEALK